MALKLIRENVDYQDLEYLIESTEESKKKTYKIKGPFLQAEVKNRNGRVYPKSLIEKEVIRYNKEKIDRRRSLGECNHSTTPELSVDRISHLVTSLVMDGNYGIGEATLVDTTVGREVKALLDANCELGMSTRGIGSLRDDRVGDDYKLISIDVVVDPSCADAYIEGILESKEYVINGDTYVEVAVDRLQKNLDKNGSKVIKEAFLQFLSDVKREF